MAPLYLANRISENSLIGCHRDPLRRLRVWSFSVALVAFVECFRGLFFAVVTGKALGRRVVVRKTDERLFPGGKKLLPRPREIGVAIVATAPLRRMRHDIAERD